MPLFTQRGSTHDGTVRQAHTAGEVATTPYLLEFAARHGFEIATIRDLIAHLKDRGIGVLITDHNVRETLGICSRAYILSDGEVIAEGSPDTILDNAQVRSVYLGDSFQL